MYQGTTPAIAYTIKGIDVSAMKAFVSFKYGNNKLLTKSGDEVTITYSDDTSLVLCPLTQEETLDMSVGSVETQIRFVTEAGQAYATNKAKIRVNEVILKGVISYGGDEA